LDPLTDHNWHEFLLKGGRVGDRMILERELFERLGLAFGTGELLGGGGGGETAGRL